MVNFPSDIDSFTNPTGENTLDSPDHSSQHTDENDAIKALEIKVGKDGSTVTTSHDYKLSNITGTEKACSLQDVYPIGSIYINASVATNPAILLGFGTWTAFGAGKVMVGLDEEDTDFDTAEKTGGAKTHILTINQMPIHTHIQNAHTHIQNAHTHSYKDRINEGTAEGNVNGTNAGGRDITRTSGSTIATNQNTTATNQNTGGGEAHNNLQPYIVVYMWKRIA